LRDRVYGLEVEYAILFEPCHGEASRPTASAVFDLIAAELQARFQTLPSHVRGKRGLFLENGALVTFETTDGVSGLLELATPECRTAREVALHQAAFDLLVSDLATAVTRRLCGGPHEGVISFGKNNADGKGHTYGSHESYLVDERGSNPAVLLRARHRMWQLIWGGGVAALVAIAWTVSIAALLTAIAVIVIPGLIRLCLALLALLVRVVIDRRGWRPPPTLDKALERLSEADGSAGIARIEAMEERLRRWLSAFSTRLLTPLITGYSRFLERVALSPFRDGLGPFLATRPVMCGAGTWAARRGDGAPAHGAFSLSPRASRMERCIGTGLAITSMIELKSLLASPTALWARRKRLEIVCGDTNRSELCVYLKIGVTGLVIRMIEEGVSFADLALADPAAALKEVAADVSLSRPLRTVGGAHLTALDIQRRYLRRAIDHLERCGSSEEERRVVALWERTLDALEHDPCSLVGQIDWVAKHVLMREIAAEAGEDLASLSATARSTFPLMRFDLRYHTIGGDAGPYDVLVQSGVMRTLSDEREKRAALTSPPQDTRAVCRSALVRAHARSGNRRVSISWDGFRGASSGSDLRFDDPLAFDLRAVPRGQA